MTRDGRGYCFPCRPFRLKTRQHGPRISVWQASPYCYDTTYWQSTQKAIGLIPQRLELKANAFRRQWSATKPERKQFGKCSGVPKASMVLTSLRHCTFAVSGTARLLVPFLYCRDFVPPWNISYSLHKWRVYVLPCCCAVSWCWPPCYASVVICTAIYWWYEGRVIDRSSYPFLGTHGTRRSGSRVLPINDHVIFNHVIVDHVTYATTNGVIQCEYTPEIVHFYVSQLYRFFRNKKILADGFSYLVF